jgi:hypothetical protein
LARIVISGAGKTGEYYVSDRSEALRLVSSRLQKEYTKSALEKLLNDWLARSMTGTLRIKNGSDFVTITYSEN